MLSTKALSRFEQPIMVPGRRLARTIPLRFVQKKAFGGAERAVNHDLPLIPFIDFLLCIVLFLLASFSASGETPPDRNLRLPKAQNVSPMTDAPIVAITGTQILVDSTLAGNTRGVEETNRLQRIEELLAILKNKRELWAQLNPGKEFPGVVVLQIDGRVPALVVKSVFQTAAMAGFPAVSFQVARLGNASGTASP
jgi:biopolymer transport protein ExbD